MLHNIRKYPSGIHGENNTCIFLSISVWQNNERHVVSTTINIINTNLIICLLLELGMLSFFVRFSFQLLFYSCLFCSCSLDPYTYCIFFLSKYNLLFCCTLAIVFFFLNFYFFFLIIKLNAFIFFYLELFLVLFCCCFVSKFYNSSNPNKNVNLTN